MYEYSKIWNGLQWASFPAVAQSTQIVPVDRTAPYAVVSCAIVACNFCKFAERDK